MNFIKKYPYLYEIPILFLLLLWAGHVFYPDSPVFHGVEPHPFWLLILLIALRYGLSAGMLSGVASAALYVTYSWYYNERYLFEDFQFYILPALFLFVGAALGLVGQKFKDHIHHLEEENSQLKDGQKNAQSEIEIQKNLNLQLEKKIVSKSSTLITLYEGARRFDNLNLEELYPAILEFILKNIEAAQGVIFLRESNDWKIKCSIGFSENVQTENVLDFLNLVANQKRSLSIRELLQNNTQFSSSKPPLFMGPLREGEEGDLKGVLLLYELPFQNLTSATLNLFSFLLLWASRAIGRSCVFEEHKKLEIFDAKLKVFSESYFESRLVEEFERSKTYYLPLSLGQIQLSMESLALNQKEYFLKGVAQILKEALRPMDVIAYFSQSKFQFAFMLITTSASQAELYKNKLIEPLKIFIEAWNSKNSNVSLALALSHYTPQLKSLDEWKNSLIFEKI